MSVGRSASVFRLGHPFFVRLLTAFAFLALAVSLLTTSLPVSRAEAKPLQSSIVIDAATGTVLSASNPDGVTQPASLTKMMTMYLLFDALKQGKIRLTDTITFSDYAASRPSTNLAVEEGDTIGVETAILAMVVRSANDVATAVGERLGGSESAFAGMMTAKARQLGMSNTAFHNASGLPDDGNRTTARDMAKLGAALLRDFPQYYPYFSRYSFTYHGVNYTGHNRLVKTFKGADGIKTGYVRASGFNLVTSAEQNGRRLVGCVLGGTTPSIRDRQMASLLQTAFLQRNDTTGPLIAKAQDSKAPDSSKSMTAAVADALAEPANASEADDAEDDSDGAPKLAAHAGDTKGLMAGATPVKSIGEGDAEEVQPMLKPGTQLAAVESGAAMIALPGSKIVDSKKPKQTAVDDQTTTNVWKSGSTGYGIQVGAYAQYKGAQRAASHATQTLPKLLSDARIVIDPQKNAGSTIYRARVVGLSKIDAENACRQLKDCMVLKDQSSGLAMDAN
ncbi:MAG TPA: D-alanyl-D-alanine carboxypeptidase [Dongiaceae bacterium]|nr:D-alanyl-D-alanine carboxypeptidase [Dongiaceae bacterium]